MFKKAKIFRKLIAILTITTMILPSFLHNSIIMANTQEVEVESSEIVENETSENGQDETTGSPENGQDETTEDTGSVEDEVIPEDGNINEDQPEDTDQNQGIDGVVTEEPSSLIGPLNRGVGNVFQVMTDGVNVNYKVLTEDRTAKTGTVTVGGDPEYTTGNAIPNGIPTNNTLTIPETVVYGGYTYTVTELQKNSLRRRQISQLNLPDSLRSIGPYALYENTMSTLVIPEGVTHIDDFAVGGIKTLKVLKLPSTLETLGSQILGSETPNQRIIIYYPYEKSIAMNSADGSTNVPFYGISEQGARVQDLIITENSEQYNKMLQDSNVLTGNAAKSCVTYEIPLEFYDKDGNSIVVDKEVKKLYFQDIFWEKGNDGFWDHKFTSLVEFKDGLTKISDFPSLPSEESLGYKANYWGLTELGYLTVSANGNVEISKTQGADSGMSLTVAFITSPKMFAVEDKLIITEEISTNKTYDGGSALKISINRNVGNYLASNGYPFYIALIDKVNNTNYKQPYFSSNTLTVNLRNVADSGAYMLDYRFVDEIFKPLQASWTSPAKDITIGITPSPINITPQVDNEIIWASQTQLPTITPTAGDTPGTYTWAANQTPELGTNPYSYTFVPDNLVGTRYVNRTGTPITANNFTEQSKSGTISITYKEIANHTVTFVDKDDSVIEIKEVVDGQTVSAPTAPDVPGYTFERWDKPLTNITSDVTIKALYTANRYTVKFDGNSGTDGADIEGDYEQPIGALSNSVREGYEFLGWFTEKTGGSKVTKDTLMPLDGATYYAHWEKTGSTGGSGGSSSEEEKDNPGDLIVDVEKDTPIEMPATKEEIKDAVLSEEEIQELVSGTDINIRVVITKNPEGTDEIVTNALEGRTEGTYFDISIYKKIGNQPEVKVTTLNKSMRFVFDVPEELYATEGITRVFEVMKVHDGKVSFLPDLDQDENTVTIETDQFSTFVLCYTDSSINEPKPNIPNTSNSTNTAALTSIAVISLIIIVLSTMQLKEKRRY